MGRPRHRHALLATGFAFGACALGASALAGCKSKGGGPLAKAEPADEAFAHVPVPAPDGPRIIATAIAGVFERPSPTAAKIGDLRAGSIVARSPEPYSKNECPGGWYAVRPRGFVCAGATATIDPLAMTRGVPGAPDPSRALPYRYARARVENVPIYARAPSPADQLAAEPDLKKHGKLDGRADAEPLGAAANDVPLDARGVPTGPPVLMPGGEGIEGGKRTAQAFFAFASDATPPTFLPAPPSTPDAVKIGGLRKGTGLAITGSLELESVNGLRRFAVTTGGQLVPTDRLKPALGSTWHGVDLEKIGLPVAFVHKTSASTYSLAKGKAQRHDDEIERRVAVPLTGKFRTVEGTRYEETRDGAWMRSQDLLVIVKRHKFPDVAKGNQRWMDVSLATQTLTAYEGTKPVYATLLSSGRDPLRDPATTAATPRGLFKVTGRSIARAMDPRDTSNAFDVADAPWVMDAEATGAEVPAVKTFSFFGAFWGDVVGEASTFHDVALAPIDARRLWTWAGAELPEGWQSVYGADDGAYVFVRP